MQLSNKSEKNELLTTNINHK